MLFPLIFAWLSAFLIITFLYKNFAIIHSSFFAFSSDLSLTLFIYLCSSVSYNGIQRSTDQEDVSAAALGLSDAIVYETGGAAAAECLAGSAKSAEESS